MLCLGAPVEGEFCPELGKEVVKVTVVIFVCRLTLFRFLHRCARTHHYEAKSVANIITIILLRRLNQMVCPLNEELLA